MILLYVLFLVLAVLSFAVTNKFSIIVRIAIALGIFVIPSIIATMWVSKVGDKPPPDSRTIKGPGNNYK
jgi:ACR3 family arsenite efflux pump ArsB